MNLQKNRSGTFVYRKVIPKELRSVIGKSEIKRSLRTKDPVEAVALSNAIDVDANHKIEAARKIVAGEKIEITVEQLQKIQNELIEAQNSAGTYASVYTDGHNTKEQITDLKNQSKSRIAKIWLDAQNRNHSDYEGWITSLLESNHLSNSENNRDKIFSAIVIALKSGVETQQNAMNGEFILPSHIQPVLSTTTHAQKKTISTKRLSEILESYLSDVQPSSQTASEWRNIFKRFMTLFGDLAIQDVTADQVRDFREALFDGRFKNTRKGRDGLSSSTVQKHLNALKAAFNWAEQQEIIDKNVINKVKIPKNRKTSSDRHPFESEDLKLLFNGHWYDENGPVEANYWIPVIAMFTGCRLEEIVQLRNDDIQCKNNVWYLNLIEDKDGGEHNRTKLKTESSKRIIPIHNRLIEIGFINFVKQAKATANVRLFSELRPNKYGRLSPYFGQQFGRYIRNVGITSPSKVFHSFRHSFKDRCREAGIPEEISDRLTGHTSASVGRSYGAGHSLEELKRAMDKIDFSDVKLAQCSFS